MNHREMTEESVHSEATDPLSLKDLILNHGMGCLYGKFGDWKINGIPVLSKSVRLGAFSPACYFGGLTFPPHNDPFLRITTLIYENTPDEQKTVNFLVVGPTIDPTSEIGKKIDIQQAVRPLAYLMWSHASHTNDARRHHVQFLFMVYLPPDKIEELIDTVIANPTAIEDAFQEIFPGLAGSGGLQRVRASALRYIDISQGPVTMQNARAVLQSSTFKELLFGKEIGEQPVKI